VKIESLTNLIENFPTSTVTFHLQLKLASSFLTVLTRSNDACLLILPYARDVRVEARSALK